MKKILFLLVLSSSITYSQDISVFFTKANLFFEKYVKDGKVSYSKIYESPNDLNMLLNLASEISVSENDAKNYQAFWINAYNLAVIKGVVNKYPIASPLDDSGFFDKNKYSLGGEKVTLNNIEHELLRAKFNDPRFHFVLVCGAIGCPPILENAYMPESLNEQLDAQTRKALHGSFILVNNKKKRVAVSEIMKWYKEDFTRNGMTEISFINSFRINKIPENYKLTYFPYNWKLNKQ